MVALLAACGCTAAGCGADIRLRVTDAASLAQADDFSITLCIDGDCSTLHVEAASEYGPDDLLSFSSGESRPGEAIVEVTTESASGAYSASGAVVLDSYRPNGSFCSPVCAGADVTIDGDSVANAEEGTFPEES